MRLLTISALAVFICLSTTQGASASEPEERSAKNSIFLEVLGPGAVYSVNYERLVPKDIGLRIGFSGWRSATTFLDTSKSRFFMVPVGLSYIGVSNGKSSLEVGGGVTMYHEKEKFTLFFGPSGTSKDFGAFGNGIVGYRLQRPDGGFQFRVGVAALYGPGWRVRGDGNDWGIFPWGYLSLGGSF